MADPGRTAPRAAVIGAGLAGLAAAYELQAAGWRVEVLEAADRAGGRVETVRRGAYLFDTGAAAIAARYPIYKALAAKLGLEPVETAPYIGVFRDGRTHLLRLDRPVRAGLGTALLPWPAKLRMVRVVADVVAAKLRGRLVYDDLREAAPLDTETASDYVRRVAGADVDRLFADPMTRVLTLANSDSVSRVELMSGLVNAMAGRLTALRGGQQALIDALVERLPGIRLNTSVRRVAETADGVEVVSGGPDGHPRTELFDGCVVACPLPDAAAICAGREELARLAKEVEFGPTVSVVIGTTTAPDTPAFLVLLPTEEDRDIASIFVESNKVSDRAPEGHGLFVVPWEMGAAPGWLDRPDEELVARACETVYRVFPEVEGSVAMTHVRRWPVALPLTRPGVFRAIGDFTAALDQGSRIQFAGDWLSQTGQNTAVAWGQKAAERLTSGRPRPSPLAS